MDSGIGGIKETDFQGKVGRRKKKKDQDDLGDEIGSIEDGQSGPTPKPRKSKARKSQNDVDTAENDPSRQPRR